MLIQKAKTTAPIEPSTKDELRQAALQAAESGVPVKKLPMKGKRKLKTAGGRTTGAVEWRIVNGERVKIETG